MIIKLNSIPKEYEAIYSELMKDTRFSNKMERNKRIEEKIKYINNYMPEIKNGGV